MFQNTPFNLPLILAVIISAVMAVIVWRKRPARGAEQAAFMLFGVTIWALTNTLDTVLVDLTAKTWFARLTYLGIVSVPATWFAFALAYTGREQHVTWPKWLPLLIEPVLVLALVLTSDYHSMWYSSVQVKPGLPYVDLDYNHAVMFWVHAIYSYVLLLGGTLLLIQSFIRKPGLYRGQVAWLLVAAFAPWLGNLIYLLGLAPYDKDLTPFAFTITSVALAFSMARYGLLDVVPVARDRLVEMLSGAVAALDANNRLVDINPAALALLNRTPADVIGLPIQEVLSDQPVLLKRFLDVEKTDAEVSFGDGDGRRYYNLVITPLRDRRDRLTGRLIVMYNITQQKRDAERIERQNAELRRVNQELEVSRRKAEEASQVKSQFLATMSHELRTPMNAVIGYVDLLMTGLPGDLNDKQKGYLERVAANSTRLLGLINDILDLSKIEAGRIELREEPFSPRALVETVQQELGGLAAAKNLELRVAVDAALPQQLLGDEPRLKQILVNLVGNAVKFTDQGYIQIVLRPQGYAGWAIEVTDTGIGIPPHAQDLIFEEFRQFNGAANREHGGTGLGLAIVNRLSRLMGGTVRLRSKVGKGSTFTVELPYRMPVRSPEKEPAA